MKNLIKKEKFVLITLPIILILLSFLIGPTNSSYILLGYIIPWATQFNEIKEKAYKKRYRYSFLRLIYHLDLFFKQNIPERFFPLGLTAFLVCLFIYVISDNGIPALSYLGSLLIFYEKKTKALAQKDDPETPQALLNEETKSEHLQH